MEGSRHCSNSSARCHCLWVWSTVFIMCADMYINTVKSQPWAFIVQLLSIWKESLNCMLAQQCITAPKVWDLVGGKQGHVLQIGAGQTTFFCLFFQKHQRLGCLLSSYVFYLKLSRFSNATLKDMSRWSFHQGTAVLSLCHLSCFWGRGLVIPYLPLVEWIYKIWYITKYTVYY